MKFTAAAAVLLATLGLVNAAGTTISSREFLRHVKAVNAAGQRRLEEQAAIAAEDSLKFQRCVSVTIGPGEENAEYLFDENMYAWTEAGTLAATMDLALFSVCDYSQNDGDADGQYCHYGGDGGDDELYMTPLANWLGNTYYVHAQFDENYCEACRQNQDYCQ